MQQPAQGTIRSRLNRVKWPKTVVVGFWHSLVLILEFFNYATFMRKERGGRWGADLVDAYLAWDVLALIAFVFIGGPLLFMSYKYSETERQRTWRLRAAVAVMYFLMTTPLFFIELWAVRQAGMVGVLQGTVFVLNFIAWFFSTWIVWFIYMLEASRFIHERRGYGRDVLFKKMRMRNAMLGLPDQWRANTINASNPIFGQPQIV